jgi:signal transduction histidine kinase
LSASENRERHWALAFEAFRIERGVKTVLESPDDLQVGNALIPLRYPDRAIWIRYLRNGIPSISVKDFLEQPALQDQVRGKALFLGVYSNTAARDRVVTPFGDHVAGVEVNAQTYETLARGDFFTGASNLLVVAFCAAVALTAGLIFAWLSGWTAYLAGAALLAAAHFVPFWMFHHGIVFPYFAPLSTAWLTVAGAAIYQHFVVRGQLRKSEVERTRYRQAIHFVTHEMRTPLTAIQGSSELIGRYNLNDDKRKQIAQMINSESKRLARMIQTFLDVERLSDGQMELKNESFEVADVVDACLDRVRPLAERKSITLNLQGPIEGAIRGDRELMEYAIYNLLTNAVKYSSFNTEISVSSHPDGDELRLSVKDQGMGMDAHELKQIFQRFYRTKRAEASGEKGSGIGLSIVDQIVQHHRGHMEVTSAPGRGSCFTVVVPALVGDVKPSPV